MKLVLVRHGESAGNTEQVFRGPGSQSDALTERGQAQARALGEHLRTLGLLTPRIYASTYRRAQDTAQAIAGALRGEVAVLDGLQEVDCGTWVGRSYRDLHDHRAEVLDRTGAPAFPGGETAAGVGRRMWQAIEPVLSPHETAVVVSHGFALQALLIVLLGADPAAAWADGRFTHENAAYSVLRQVDGEWTVAELAQVAPPI
ncbi:histidine phosphatase family protein [Deinococcus koreensis]|uniref:Histidine phosphatase family protein n=1 Tax=Deinococcus koreensis TaxID=2054903 RepID=A0A2K3UXD5_9DEIO|nr:histidine phosphatase family protein [Deinococcus koreensis]PNY81197.1 histidine phosphatase family protein [Deinococcus koreensis]